MNTDPKKIVGLGSFLAALILAVDRGGDVAVPGRGEAGRRTIPRVDDERIREEAREDALRESSKGEKEERAEEERDEDPILDTFPGVFFGTYRWDDSDSPSTIVLIVKELDLYDEETLVFSGTTDYDDGSLVVDINGDIDRHTLEIEFSESNPEGNAAIDGVFRGYVRGDFRAIYARWVPFDEEGRTGSLEVEGAEPPDPGAPVGVTEVRRGRR
jgi:hypothetical protein